MVAVREAALTSGSSSSLSNVAAREAALISLTSVSLAFVTRSAYDGASPPEFPLLGAGWAASCAAGQGAGSCSW